MVTLYPPLEDYSLIVERRLQASVSRRAMLAPGRVIHVRQVKR
jgi:hypothetical protein